MKKTTWTLEMTSRDDLRPKRVERPGLRLERVGIPCAEFSKFLHTVVGYNHRWGGRDDWGPDEWARHAERDSLETWVLYVSGTPAGYFELERQLDGSVQIWCFGLLPQFIGQRLGGHLLTEAVERAWDLGATRVWLRTCSHDHPHALENYQARGFRVAQETKDPANPPIRSIWG